MTDTEHHWETGLNRFTSTLLHFQPLFAVPIYFSVLINIPPLWLSLIISVIPLGLRFGYTHRFGIRTPFDIPIIIFICGSLVGLILAPNKGVAVGALSSTVASILVFYGIVSNSKAGYKYWLWLGVILCFITLLLSLWFLSQSERRILFFNQWVFNLFGGLPKTTGPVLQLNTIGALLAVVIPLLFGVALFHNRRNLLIAALISGLFFALMLFLSDSGAGWISVAAAVSLILICWRLWTLGVLIPAAGGIIASVVIFYDKVAWLGTTFSTSSLMGRIKFWENTITLLHGRSAITGLGLGAWYEVYGNKYGFVVPHVHNSYIQLYSDTGILGAIAAVIAAVIFVRLAINILKSPKRNGWYGMGIGIIASIVAGAIFAIFDVTYTVTYVTATGYIYLSIPLLWLFAASLVVANKKLRETVTMTKVQATVPPPKTR